RVRAHERPPSRGGPRRAGETLVAQIEVVADGHDGRRAIVLHVHQLVAGPRDDGAHLGRADGENPRGPESLADHLADDLERRQHVLGDADAEALQPDAQVAAGGTRVVRDEGDRASAPVERSECLARAGVEDVAVPDAAVEVEDETPKGREAQGGHERQASVRANSSIASAYTSRVRSATLLQATCASTRSRPARPIARARAASPR